MNCRVCKAHAREAQEIKEFEDLIMSTRTYSGVCLADYLATREEAVAYAKGVMNVYGITKSQAQKIIDKRR